MVMPRGGIAGRLDAQLAAHAEVNAQPRAAAKAKDHLLRRRLRAEIARARQRPAQCGGIGAAEDPGAIMREHRDDAPPAGGLVPAFAVKFSLGELGHKLALSAPPCFPAIPKGTRRRVCGVLG